MPPWAARTAFRARRQPHNASQLPPLVGLHQPDLDAKLSSPPKQDADQLTTISTQFAPSQLQSTHVSSPIHQVREITYTDPTADLVTEEVYTDNFPISSAIWRKVIDYTSAFGQFLVAIGFFIQLFQDQLTYTRFWLIFAKVSLSCCFLVAAFRPRSFRHWAFKNCRLLLNQQYIVFLMLVLCQAFEYEFSTARIYNFVGGIFLCVAMLLYVLILLVWAVGRCRRKL